MKKVYLVYYNDSYNTDIIKAFSTKHEAEEYIKEHDVDENGYFQYRHHLKSIKIEKKKKFLTKQKLCDIL